MDFKDKVVVVTGASAGMGRETAKRFGAAGAKVVVNYASAEKEADATVDAIRKAGGTAIACKADVSQQADAERLIAAAVKEYGRIDILINNAGVTRFIPFDDLDAASPEVWQKLYSINVIGSFNCARAAAKEMKKVGGGVIVNLASISGHRAAGSSIPYSVSKAAVLQMTRCLAIALAPDIRVCSVSPGYIEDTRWNAGRENFDAGKAAENAAQHTLLKRTGTAAEVADAVLYIASDQARYCTGNDLLVDGGRFFRV